LGTGEKNPTQKLLCYPKSVIEAVKAAYKRNFIIPNALLSDTLDI
jgi:hypothetical protein